MSLKQLTSMTYGVSIHSLQVKPYNVSNGSSKAPFARRNSKKAVYLVEHGDADGLSLRAVAAEIGVKAPSLYRYFSDKEALEVAVAEEVLTVMLTEFRTASADTNPSTRFRNVVNVYLRFARERFPLYTFVMQHNHPERYASGAGKAVWDLIIDAASAVSEKADDTAAAVATLAFLHGYVTLEHSGAFGPSGPKEDWSEV
jgi:AcrR family transcriptional regulator